MSAEEPRFGLLEDLARQMAHRFNLRPYTQKDPAVHCRWLRRKYRLFHIDDAFLDETEPDNPQAIGEETVELVVHPSTKREISVRFLLDRRSDYVSIQYVREDLPFPILKHDNYKQLDGGPFDAAVLRHMAIYLASPRRKTPSPVPVYVSSFDLRHLPRYQNTLLDVLTECLL